MSLASALGWYHEKGERGPAGEAVEPAGLSVALRQKPTHGLAKLSCAVAYDAVMVGVLV